MNQLAERNAEYVMTIAELEEKCAAMTAKLSMINDLMEAAEQANKLAQEATETLLQDRNALAAENAVKQEFIKTCFRASADGASMDGDDIQKLGERLGLFVRETYQPVLHGYICGHEAGEDTVYVMKKTPATDAFLAEVRASELDSLAGVAETMLVKFSNQQCSSDMHEVVGWKMVHQQAGIRAAQLRKGVAE
ncbi:hypothetical protein FA577_16305 [Salmonella enterica]|nr:hypothetical protein [Salmonella enterica]EEJ7413685.1 hypothetical protein [Salmonella enterica subsp. enterica serovar Sandiego]